MPGPPSAGGGRRVIFWPCSSAGAYGFVMASNYNTRPLAAEILVDGDQSALVRRRQRPEEIWAAETIPSWLPPVAAVYDLVITHIF